jgi:eukaryotic-like serine/threonine-protein kinase
VPAGLNAMIDRVIGNYRIVEKVGEGGMGTVYRAVDVMLERDVAIKAIRPELSREPEIVERFRAEAKMLARLSHPAIATIFSFFVDGEDVFLAMEFVRGRSLSAVLQSAGPLPWERVVPLLAGALDGIEQAHRVGIVHRDLKSDNLMVTESGTVKVMDFGIARLIGSSRLTRTGLLVGTLHYMAPEQIRGEEVDRRTDVYALGAVLYEMLTGRVPFQGSSDYAVLKAHVEENPAPPSSAMPGLPPWLDRAILKALAKAPDERFQTVEDLRLYLQGHGSPAAAGPTFVIPAADQPTLHMAPTVASARPPAAATPPAPATPPPAPAATPPMPAATPPGPPRLAMPPSTPATPPPTRFGTPSPTPGTPPPAPIPPSSPAQPVSQAAHPAWAGGRRLPGLFVAAAVAALLIAAVLYRVLAAPPARPRAPDAIAAGKRAAGPVTTGNAALPRGAPGVAGGPGGTGGTGAKGGAGVKEIGGTGTRSTSASAGGTRAGAGGAGAAGAGATSASGTGTGADGASAGGAGTSAGGAEPRTRGKRARLGAGDGASSTRRAGTAADASSSTGPAGRQASGAATESAGGKDDRAASATGTSGRIAGSGSAASGVPDDELRRLGGELEPESDQIRNLYADFLSQKEKGGSRLTDADDKLKDELKDLQRAVDGFRVQFQTGFWARTRKGFGRLSHSEDQRAQVARVARALAGSASRVDALMAQVKPDPAVRELWRRIHEQCQRIAELCGL